MDGGFVLRFCGAVIGFAFGGVWLKRYADHGQLLDLSLALTAYLLANLAFIDILKRGLGVSMVLSSMGQLCLMVIIGALVFGERIGPVQGAGLIFALLAMAAFAYGAEAR